MGSGRGGGGAPPGTGDEAIPVTSPGDLPDDLDGLMRMDVGTLEEMLPQILDAVARGPLVLTRQGRAFAVLLPLDAYRLLLTRAEEAASSPTVIEGEAASHD